MSHTTTYTTDAGDLVIEFDYQPKEPKTWNDPGTPESADILSVMAGPFDILEWCCKSSIAFFEEKALESMADSRTNAAYDRGQSKYEERMAA